MRDEGAHAIDDNAWLLDDEDIRVLAGAMGRFPCFRPIGWRILDSARVLEPSPHAASFRRCGDDPDAPDAENDDESRAPDDDDDNEASGNAETPTIDAPAARATSRDDDGDLMPSAPDGAPSPRPGSSRPCNPRRRSDAQRAEPAAACGTPSVSLAMFARD